MAQPGGGDDRTWLGMLLEGAPLSDLEDFRARRVASAAAGQVARIESEARRALHLHALLAERKRHAAELTVLNDLARRLTTMHHPNEVLAEVAGQTRRLLGVDVAYIMRACDHEVLRIEVVDGSLGSTLRGIELPRGVGLGGRVLQTGKPHWSENYVQDTALRHRKSVDAAAASEQLGGILGVPLRVGDETIGVLLAADRSPRLFTEHEVGLLTSLAAHAAVAIHNAELFDQYQRAADQLHLSNESVRRTAELHERLTKIVLGGGGLGQVVDALGAALEAEVVVLDAGDRVIPEPADNGGREEVLSGLVAELTPAKRFRDRGARGTSVGRSGSSGWAIAPIVVADDYAGCVVARREQDFDQDATRSVETGAMVVGLVLTADRAVAEAERRAQGEFVAALLGGHADQKTIRRRATAAGVSLSAIRTVVVLDPGAGDTAPAAKIATNLARDRKGWPAEFGGQWVVLLTDDNAGRVRDQVQTLIADASPVTAAVASTRGNVAGVRDAYTKARHCTALLAALGRAGGCAIADELGLYHAVFAQAGREELQRFIEATIGPLLRHDERHNSELVPTLETYLAQSGKHAATAQALFIHANTLYQRLARISEVLGDAWKYPDRALEVQLAIRLHRLSEYLAGPR